MNDKQLQLLLQQFQNKKMVYSKNKSKTSLGNTPYSSNKIKLCIGGQMI